MVSERLSSAVNYIIKVDTNADEVVKTFGPNDGRNAPVVCYCRADAKKLIQHDISKDNDSINTSGLPMNVQPTITKLEVFR